jgi:excisionase family DNA binding protein
VSETDIKELVKDGAMTLAEATRFSGIGRTQLYDLMGKNVLRFLRCGNRRLIPREELRKYLAGQLELAAAEVTP